jgi:cytochrome c oxidase subunit 2
MEQDPRSRSRQLAVRMFAIGLVSSILGVALGLAIDWFPPQGSTQARKIDDLYDVLIIASVPIFVLVQVVVLFSVWKFRVRPGEEFKDGPPVHGNYRLEVILRAVPAILVVGLCAYSYAVLQDLETEPPGEMNVQVTGQQFTWSFAYPPARPGERPVRSNQLYLPQGRSVKFLIRAKDVIHDFWVPAFRMKIDAVPGITTSYRITPARLGTYPGVCAELCGSGHATMRVPVRVVKPAAFQQWLRRQGAAAGASAAAEGSS